MIHRACVSVAAGMAPDEFAVVTALRAHGYVRSLVRVELEPGMCYPPGVLLNAYPTLVLFPAEPSPHPVTWCDMDSREACQVEKVSTGKQYQKDYSLRECLATSVARCALFFRKVELRDGDDGAAAELAHALGELWVQRAAGSLKRRRGDAGRRGAAEEDDEELQRGGVLIKVCRFV